MEPSRIFEAMLGMLSVYIGIRIAIAGKVAVVSEGSSEPHAWLKGLPAVAVGILVVAIGALLLGEAFGFVALRR